MKRIWIITLAIFIFSFQLVACAYSAENDGEGIAGGGMEADDFTVSPTAFSEAYGEYIELGNLGSGTRAVVFGSDEVSFKVTSVLLFRNQRALLVDSKFTKTDAQRILSYLRDSGAALTHIFISHGDPDYYFGLEEIKEAHPRVIARTTPSVANRITRTILNKLGVWAEALGAEIPQNIVLPQIMNETSFDFEGLTVRIFGSDPTRITLYIPQLNMLLGGANITAKNHLFLADMSSNADRGRWLDNLIELRNVSADVVIPGHTDLSTEAFDRSSIDFSIGYLRAVGEELATAQNSGAFIRAMQGRYPDLGSSGVLELSARVLTGEMEWEEEAEVDIPEEETPSSGGSGGCNSGFPTGGLAALGFFGVLAAGGLSRRR